MDESVQKALEKAELDPDILERLKNGKDQKEPRYAWRYWENDWFCGRCLLDQPLSFKEVLRRHGFWETGISMYGSDGRPTGRPFPLDKEEP